MPASILDGIYDDDYVDVVDDDNSADAWKAPS